MAEQTFKSPGFFEREIDLTGLNEETIGTPAGIIGTAKKGPAFVPISVGSLNSLIQRFGEYDNENFGMIAAKQFLQHIPAVTFVRVLGAGANATSGDLSNTSTYGTVKNAGFRLSGSIRHGDSRDIGGVQFLVAAHDVNEDEEVNGYPIFSQNQSTGASSTNLVRAMILLASGARMEVMNYNQSYVDETLLHYGKTPDDSAKISSYNGATDEGTFKLVISSSLGTVYSNDEKFAGVKIYTASLNPGSKYYIGNLLNTAPDMFHSEQHLLYGEFPVNHSLAKVKYHADNASVAIVSGSNDVSAAGNSGLYFREVFGSFNTRYQTAKTTSFISQPFSGKEYNLFHFEALDDGVAGNHNVKISVSNLKKSTDPNNPYGTFTVQVRNYEDTDSNLQVLEQFSQCSLNPDDPNYVLTKIGDKKLFYDFDSSIASERGLKVAGGSPNKSKYVRIVVYDSVKNRDVPANALPFGFRGLPVLKTNDALSDTSGGKLTMGFARTRLTHSASANEESGLDYSIVPPVPFTFKATRNKTEKTKTPGFTGSPNILELTDARVYWGIKTADLMISSSNGGDSGNGDTVLRANAGGTVSETISSYSKMLGIYKLDALTTGSGADAFCNNKFTLAQVALNHQSVANVSLESAIDTELTGTIAEHMKEAAYIRHKSPKGANLVINDTGHYTRRLTFGSLIAFTGSAEFNKYSDFMKFTNIMYGGFDGVNILDRDQVRMNDRATSTESGGKAASGTSLIYENLQSVSSPGVDRENNSIVSYKAAINTLTNEYTSKINILAIPGIKDPRVVDDAADKVKEYGKAIYLMDLPAYDKNGKRLFLKSTNNINVTKTINKFNSRALDNNFVATYFPDVIMYDNRLNQNVTVPSSIASLKALGNNDENSYPWFAPAGFNRGALENVANVKTRLTAGDKDSLYESGINPIASFPNGGTSTYVIFGQKTLQKSKSALDRVNVRRMLLEVKRIVSNSARKLIFEKNTQKVKNKFISDVTPKLGTIQSQQGIDKFKVIMDSSNNTERDGRLNRLNGRIVLVPTRAVEFISIDFVITNSGVSFE